MKYCFDHCRTTPQLLSSDVLIDLTFECLGPTYFLVTWTQHRFVSIRHAEIRVPYNSPTQEYFLLLSMNNSLMHCRNFVQYTNSSSPIQNPINYDQICYCWNHRRNEPRSSKATVLNEYIKFLFCIMVLHIVDHWIKLLLSWLLLNLLLSILILRFINPFQRRITVFWFPEQSDFEVPKDCAPNIIKITVSLGLWWTWRLLINSEIDCDCAT